MRPGVPDHGHVFTLAFGDQRVTAFRRGGAGILAIRRSPPTRSLCGAVTRNEEDRPEEEPAEAIAESGLGRCVERRTERGLCEVFDRSGRGVQKKARFAVDMARVDSHVDGEALASPARKPGMPLTPLEIPADFLKAVEWTYSRPSYE